MSCPILASRAKILKYRLQMESLKVKIDRSSRLIVKHREAYLRDHALRECTRRQLVKEEAKMNNIILLNKKRSFKEEEEEEDTECMDVGEKFGNCQALFYRKTRQTAWKMCESCQYQLCTKCSKNHLCSALGSAAAAAAAAPSPQPLPSPGYLCVNCGSRGSCACTSPASPSLSPPEAPQCVEQPSLSQSPIQPPSSPGYLCVNCGSTTSCACTTPASPSLSPPSALPLPQCVEQSSLPPLASDAREVGIEMLIVKKEPSLEAEEPLPLPHSSAACDTDFAFSADIEMMELKREMSSEELENFSLRYSSEEENDEAHCQIEFESVIKIERCSEDENVDVTN